MKKLLLSLALITALIVTATACQTSDAPPSTDRTGAASTKSTSDTDLPKPTQSTVTTTTVTTRPVTTPPVTDNREIVYNRVEGMIDILHYYSCKYVKNQIDETDDLGFPAALCLVTVTEIETSHEYTPVHVTIEKIYQSTDEFKYKELDSLTGLSLCSWSEENGKYTLFYYDNEIPIPREGYQYIVYIRPILASGSNNQILHVTAYDNYEYDILAMTIPINENIDNEDYVNEWYDTLGINPEFQQKCSEEFLETFYRSSTEAQ